MHTSTVQEKDTSTSASPCKFVGWKARNVDDISPVDICSKFGNSSSSVEHLSVMKIEDLT